MDEICQRFHGTRRPCRIAANDGESRPQQHESDHPCFEFDLDVKVENQGENDERKAEDKEHGRLHPAVRAEHQKTDRVPDGIVSRPVYL